MPFEHCLAADDAAGTILRLVTAAFRQPRNLEWYSQRSGISDLNPEDAARHFLGSAATQEVSPVPLFDPGWFRSRFRVSGVNSFVEYVSNPKLRLAPPSPAFLPRWYAAQNRIARAVHPLAHFLSLARETSPHPLIDVDYLAAQDSTIGPDDVASAYLYDSRYFRLRPHPLFDGERYLEENPAVAEVNVNPLLHYLYFGSDENRSPNLFFNVKWYRHSFLETGAGPVGEAKKEPLTDYVTGGFARGRVPGPGLGYITRPAQRPTGHGPDLLVEAVTKKENIYARVRRLSRVSRSDFVTYMSGSIEKYNPAFAAEVALIPRHKLAIMYSPKCASAKILYWWIEKIDLLPTALRFSPWSHDFESIYRLSEEYIRGGLRYDPRKWRSYKFVRHPVLRAVSTFTHFLSFPRAFNISLGDASGCSFVRFLDIVAETGLMARDAHCRLQTTRAEKEGLVRPVALKLEDGLDRHLAEIERKFGLRQSTFEHDPEIAYILRHHAKQPGARLDAGPHDVIPFGQVPLARSLIGPDAVARIHDMYRLDFDTYGYDLEPDRHLRRKANRAE